MIPFDQAKSRVVTRIFFHFVPFSFFIKFEVKGLSMGVGVIKHPELCQ